MYHPNSVQQTGYALDHTDRIGVVKWFAKLLERVKELDIVFGFVRVICNLFVDLSPRLKFKVN